jgi:hypothetical protein
MSSFLDIVNKKAHQSSIKRLGEKIPNEILEYIEYELLNDVAKSLSSVTHNGFLYTGIIKEGEECLKVEYKSSDQVETVSMLIHYDVSLNEEGFDFEGLNEQMEKVVNGDVKEPEEPEEIEIVEEVVEKPKKTTPKKKVDPKVLDKVLDTLIEKDQKEKSKKDVVALDKALDSMVEKEKTKKKTKQAIDLLEKLTEPPKKKEINPIDVLKKIVANEKEQNN